MDAKSLWNSWSPKEREDFIEGIYFRTHEKIGASNSKCTYDKISEKLKVYVEEAAKKGDKILEDLKDEYPVRKTDSLELCCMFDDTGSMSSVRKIVRQKIDELTTKLFNDIPGLRMSIMILNDYCDYPKELLIQDFTSDRNVIKRFIHSDSPCGGGDSDECYEYALRTARSLNWSSDNRAMVLIGDANPHEVGYTYRGKRYDIDWREECEALRMMDVKIYSVHALGSRHSAPFYEKIARITNGAKLDLSQFQHVETYIKAVAYRQNGNLEEFENSDPMFKTNLSLKNMFRKLKGLMGDSATEDKMEFLSKFQVLDVITDGETTIRDFVEMNGCTFKKGRGYYQLIERTADGKANSEIIQSDKEVVFVNKLTGEVSEDTSLNRRLLGIPYGTKGTCRPLQIPEVMGKYDIFVQSNSVNRKLDSGTKFLYELTHV